MAYTRFNGATATITTAASVAIATDVGITSFSYDAGSRAEIDITTSVSVRRSVAAGFVSPRRVTLGLLLDALTIAELDSMIAECSAGTVAVSFGVDCAAPASLLSLSSFLMSYSISGELDGVLEVSCEFMVAEV